METRRIDVHKEALEKMIAVKEYDKMWDLLKQEYDSEFMRKKFRSDIGSMADKIASNLVNGTLKNLATYMNAKKVTYDSRIDSFVIYYEDGE